ncbi:hypothetical protein Q4602_13075 [Paraglaciecola chathamensis]|uniref:hypothetical protein n=1 Tax=Paraglaciecola chathamensis TaxID=368405 RepID=UPI0026F7190F|nr:hypothetical protein [Paraglaciecola chathamensis]MDO6840411.1 hypothetical protein [Paraglaciecola chathamensis]
MSKLSSFSIVMCITAGSYSSLCMAQSTPSEFAELSLNELFEMDIADDTAKAVAASPWTFAYNFKFAEFRGYLDGDAKRADSEVLWQGQGTQRSDENFPILPTVIDQQVHVFSMGYRINADWRVHASIPYITQSTDHISIVPDYDHFTIDSDGSGDAVLSVSHRLIATSEDIWWFTAGVSLPTGSIDEKGDTPRDVGDQQLPYTMQLGSGTYDFPVEFSYQSMGKHDFSLSMSAMIRTGKNDRDYRLGNSYSLSGTYRFNATANIKPFLGLAYQYRSAIHGQDDEITLAGAFPYPASITNPRLYGGKKVSAEMGVRWKFSETYALSVSFSKPIYQNLNGPQPKENFQSGITLSRLM